MSIQRYTPRQMPKRYQRQGSSCGSWWLTAPYAAAMLPVTPYFKAGNSRIPSICDNQYTTTLKMLTKNAS